MTCKVFLFFAIQMMSASIWAGPIDKEMEMVLQQYSRIHISLTNDTTAGVDSAAQSIVKITAGIKTADTKVLGLTASVTKAAQAIQGKDLEAARSEFFELSKPLLAYVYQLYSGEQEYFRFYCGMAKKGWVQESKDLRNPYYGSSMLSCGELIQ